MLECIVDLSGQLDWYKRPFSSTIEARGNGGNIHEIETSPGTSAFSLSPGFGLGIKRIYI